MEELKSLHQKWNKNNYSINFIFKTKMDLIDQVDKLVKSRVKERK